MENDKIRRRRRQDRVGLRTDSEEFVEILRCDLVTVKDGSNQSCLRRLHTALDIYRL